MKQALLFAVAGLAASFANAQETISVPTAEIDAVIDRALPYTAVVDRGLLEPAFVTRLPLRYQTPVE